MIATSERLTTQSDAKFVSMIPFIHYRARRAFRHFAFDAREDAVAEVVAKAFVAYRRLHDLDRLEIVYPLPLTLFAIRQVKAGRRVGDRLNIRDITSVHCQIATGVRVKSLHWLPDALGVCREFVVEDRRATPAEIAALRIDFAAWLATLTPKKRRAVRLFAMGESLTAAAVELHLSIGRVSQIRRELEADWLRFQSHTDDSLRGSSDKCRISSTELTVPVAVAACGNQRHEIADVSAEVVPTALEKDADDSSDHNCPPLVDPLDVNLDPEPYDLPPQVVDWDALALTRNVPVFA